MAKAEIQLDESLTFQRREWAAQRVGWWVLGMFVLASAAGVFGKGPLSHAAAGTPGDPIWIEYERFVRVGSSSRIVVHFIATEGTAPQLLISRAYYDALRIEHIHPDAVSAQIGADVVTFGFGPLGGGERSIVLDVEPLRIGRQTGTVAVSPGGVRQLAHVAFF